MYPCFPAFLNYIFYGAVYKNVIAFIDVLLLYLLLKNTIRGECKVSYYAFMFLLLAVSVMCESYVCFSFRIKREILENWLLGGRGQFL